MEWMFHCCSRDTHDGRGELQVLSADPSFHHQRNGTLSSDSFDLTFSPRAANVTIRKETLPVTPRQKDLRDTLKLPKLSQYPTAPDVTSEDSEETKQQRLLEMYQEFVLELHTGTYLTQLTSTRDYSDIHCQLMEDLVTLKLDQSSGRIIEFPLTGVSKVYRIIREDDRWYRAQGTAPSAPAEHIVVVEFMRRKLAFVFKEVRAALRFLTCMELLIRRAQQQEVEKLRYSTRGLAKPVSPVLSAKKDDESPEMARKNRSMYVCM